jgi:hypothetical protein
MKPSASRIERMLAKVEAALVPPSREWLRVIIDDGDDEAEVKKKRRRCLPNMWPAILKMSAARLRTSTGYCGRSSDQPPRFWNADYGHLPELNRERG